MMRASLCLATGSAGAFAWFVIIMARGAPEMAYYGGIQGNATSFLNDANTKYNAARNALKDTQDRIVSSEQAIVDANCFINQYSSFSAKFNTYCAPAMKPGNNVDILNAFGLEIARVADKITPSIIADSYRLCYPGDQPDTTSILCKEDKEGNLYDCPPVQVCETYQYSYTRTVNELHGTLIQGPGSEIKMDCAKYTQAITVNKPIKSTTDTGLQSIYTSVIHYGKYKVDIIQSQSRTTRDSSKVDININVDSNKVTTASTANVDPNIVSLSVAAAPVIQAIAAQCTNLNKTISTPARYQAIIDNSNAALVTLRNDAIEKQKAVDAAAIYQKEKQDVFNDVNQDYQQALTFWLPQLFVGVLGLIAFCCVIESCLRDKDPELENTPHIDTDEPCCGVPTPRISLPSFNNHKAGHSLSENSAPNVTYDAENPPRTALDVLSRSTQRTVAQTTSGAEYGYKTRAASAHSAPSYDESAPAFNPQATLVSEGSTTAFAQVYEPEILPVAQVVKQERERSDSNFKLAMG